MYVRTLVYTKSYVYEKNTKSFSTESILVFFLEIYIKWCDNLLFFVVETVTYKYNTFIIIIIIIIKKITADSKTERKEEKK